MSLGLPDGVFPQLAGLLHFDRKEIARFFQDATAFMDGFHGSFAAEELYAAAAFIAVEADDLDDAHHTP